MFRFSARSRPGAPPDQGPETKDQVLWVGSSVTYSSVPIPLSKTRVARGQGNQGKGMIADQNWQRFEERLSRVGFPCCRGPDGAGPSTRAKPPLRRASPRRFRLGGEITLRCLMIMYYRTQSHLPSPISYSYILKNVFIIGSNALLLSCQLCRYFSRCFNALAPALLSAATAAFSVRKRLLPALSCFSSRSSIQWPASLRSSKSGSYRSRGRAVRGTTDNGLRTKDPAAGPSDTLSAPTSRRIRSPWLIEPVLMSSRASISANPSGSGLAKQMP